MGLENLQDDVSDIELKQRWRLYWIHAIFEFSNVKLQKMAWVEPEKTQWPDEVWDSSYEACISAYFDTLALDDAYKKAVEVGNVTKEEAEMAQEFHTLAAWYMEPSSEAMEIINDEEWLEVVEAAQGFWNFLKAEVSAPREKALIAKLEADYA